MLLADGAQEKCSCPPHPRPPNRTSRVSWTDPPYAQITTAMTDYARSRCPLYVAPLPKTYHAPGVADLPTRAAVTYEDVKSLKNDWLTDNVRISVSRE